MKKINLLPLMLLSLALGTLMVVANVSAIPGSYEMGAIGLAFETLVVSIIIYTIAITISLIVSSYKTDYQILIQVFIYCFCTYLVYYTSWRICVYHEPSKNNKEIWKSQLDELPDIIQKGNEILNKIETKPSKKIVVSDSILISNYLFKLLTLEGIAPYNEKDSLYHSTFYFFFNRVLNNMDSLEIINLRKTILKSCSIDKIIYSPDNKFIIPIITFETDKNCAQPSVFIGERDSGKLILYRYPCYVKNSYVNKKYAFYNLIIDFENNYRPCSKGSPLKDSFWENGYFKQVKINGLNKYLYQVNLIYNQPGKEYDSTYVQNVIIKD